MQPSSTEAVCGSSVEKCQSPDTTADTGCPPPAPPVPHQLRRPTAPAAPTLAAARNRVPAPAAAAAPPPQTPPDFKEVERRRRARRGDVKVTKTLQDCMDWDMELLDIIVGDKAGLESEEDCRQPSNHDLYVNVHVCVHVSCFVKATSPRPPVCDMCLSLSLCISPLTPNHVE